MWTWAKRFLFDETAFVGLARGVCLGLGSAVSTGILDVEALGVSKAVGVALMGLGGFIRAGEKNPKDRAE